MSRRAEIIPFPKSLRYTGGELHLTAPIEVYASIWSPEIVNIIEVCNATLRSIGGPSLAQADRDWADDCRGVRLVIDSEWSGAEGSYRLSVGEGGVDVAASTPMGVLYGMQSLVQLLSESARTDGELALPCLEAEDSPRFRWRGMHLDVCRHFMPVAFVKTCIDLLAFHKMNVFHWHLTDDQGWRIEIPRYPRLTEIGAWRTEQGGERYGGYYTQAEIREIVRYAQERFVTVVPEIELPGHASAALAAYPDLSCTGGPFEVPITWGVFDDVYCAGKESAFTFLKGVLEETAALFPGGYLHIGGDECPKTRWQNHDLCRQRMKDLNLRSEDELQAYFVAHIGRHLAKLGKRMVGWDEILDGGAPDGAVIMAWRSVEKGIEAAQAGHEVVMCPMSHCYLDHYQSLKNEPKAIGGHTPLEKIYDFEPIPDGLPAGLERQIMGAQGNVWTEYMPNERHVEYMVFPRLVALSEVLWSPKETRSWPDFRERLRTHLRRLEAWGVNFRRLTV